MPDNKFKELLDKYLDGTATSDEIKRVEEWYDAFSQGKQSTLQDFQREAMQNADWMLLKRQIRKEKGRQRTLWPRISAVAATFIGIAVIVYFGTPLMKDAMHSATVQQTDSTTDYHSIPNTGTDIRTLALADGSIVSLYPGSTLSIASDFDVNVRKVSLTGRASFNVSRNESKPFLVITNEVITKVLGTSFSVEAYPLDAEIRVAVTSGAVSVSSNEGEESTDAGQSVILKPNQQAIYNKNNRRVSRMLVDEPQIILSPEELSLIRFESAAVSKILATLERMYGVDIEFDEKVFSTCSMTTSVSKGNLYEKIDIICDIAGASYTIEGTRIRVTGTGCK